MRFIQNKIASLTTLAVVLTAAYAAPVAEPNTYTLSDDLADRLDMASKRDVITYTVSDDLADKLDGLAQRDIDSSNLEARGDKAPTVQDFYDFAEKQGDKHGDKLVFWAGTGPGAAGDFAKKYGRVTLQQLLDKKWEKYQTAKADGGHWETTEEAAQMFWRPLSRAFAEYAKDEVWVIMGVESDDGMSKSGLTDNSRPECTNCWSQAEKPMLVSSLHAQKSPKVTKIRKFNRDGKDDGEITTI